MTAMLQLPGIDQGLLPKLLGSGGAVGRLEKTPLQADSLPAALKQWLESSDTSAPTLTPELQAMLAQLLDSGSSLPDLPLSGDAEGKLMPPFAALAQLLTDKSKEDAPVSGSIGDGLSGIGEAVDGSAGDLLDFPIKPGAVLEGAIRREFDVLMSQANGDRQPPPLLAQALPTAAGLAIPTAPAMQGTPIPSQNLLSMPVPQPVTDPAWGAAIGERLVWMAKGDHQIAELKISPPNLGPLEVRLHINNDQASVTFVSHHALVRDAIESAIPRLREMLAEQSLNLVQADVGSGPQGDAHRSEAQERNVASFSFGGDVAGDEQLAGGQAAAGPERRGLGLLDLFV